MDAIWDNLRHNFVPAALRALAPDAVEPELPTEEQCNVSGLGEGASSRQGVDGVDRVIAHGDKQGAP